MKKNLFSALLLSILILGFSQGNAAPAPEGLSQDLESLQMPSNQLPLGVEHEKLYSVQTRHSPLRLRPEIMVGGGYNLTNNSYLQSYQADVGLRFHISNRFSIAASYAWVSNSFSQDAKQLIDDKGVLPDVAYVLNKMEATVAFNTFYGKFRLAMDSIYYFDQYIAIGAGRIAMNTGTETAYIGDAGFAFWLSTWGSIRIGVKDYYYRETQRSGKSAMAHNIHGHVDVGYIF